VAEVFEEEREALHQRVGRERGERVFQLVALLDNLERNRAAGRLPSAKPPRGSAADLREELRRVLELSDADLIRLAAIADDAARQARRTHN
jgi:hypothetical protein